jgi:class 3 adenylate cyclase
MEPEIQYTRSGDVAIAYQVLGEGSVDLVFVPFVTNLAYVWEGRAWREFFTRLAESSRVILFDKRGTGLSDRPRELPTLEARMDDVRAVLDAVGSESAALLGSLEGCQMAALFAATYPERTRALVLQNPSARVVTSPDYPWGLPVEEWHRRLREVREHWGEREFLERLGAQLNPRLAEEDDEYLRWLVTLWRLAASPASAYAFYRMWMETDIRHVLPAIRVPTLVLYRQPQEGSSLYVAERIPGARSIALPGSAEGLLEDLAVAEETERFLLELGGQEEPERVLTTVLFTDIVGSSDRAAALGDRAWRELLEQHHALVRRNLVRYRGEEVDTAGDGFVASFDGPARAIRCARAIVEAVGELGLKVRAGLHTGECELLDGKVAGIAVHTGARVAAEAGPDEVLVSSTVKDLVAGSGLAFQDRGTHELKGVPGEWRLYAVAP